MIDYNELKQLPEGELRTLNKMVVELLNNKSRQRSLIEASRYCVGDEVEFTNRMGARMVGTVKKVNTKSLSIEVRENGTLVKWKVSYCYVKKIVKEGI